MEHKKYICINDDAETGYDEGTVLFKIVDIKSGKHWFTDSKFSKIRIHPILVEYNSNWREHHSEKLIYIVYSVQEEVIGVADSPDEAIKLYSEKYQETGWEYQYITKADGTTVHFKSEYEYLRYYGRIEEYELNKLYNK